MPYYLLTGSHTNPILNKGYIRAWITTGILISSNLNGCFIQFEGEYVFSNLYTVSTLVNN